jgi:hypothetical protein
MMACAAFTGCTSYHLGSALPPNLKTIYVPTFANETGHPQLEFDTTSATLREFQKDGTLKVTSQDQADAILETKLVRYELVPLRYRSDQRTTANEYRLILTADVVLLDGRTRKVLMQTSGVIGESTFLATSDLQAQERNALPTAARDLAHHIVETVVEYW